MNRLTLVIAAISPLILASDANAADHLFTATAAGGLTLSSQPFQNGTNGQPGRFNDTVPGQGSPLSGGEHSTPASDTPTTAVGTTPKPVTDGKTAPSTNSVH